MSDLAAVRSSLLEVHRPETSGERRVALSGELSAFESSEGAWEVAFALLESEVSAANAPLLHWAAGALERKVAFDFGRLPPPQREDVREGLFGVLERMCVAAFSAPGCAGSGVGGFAGAKAAAAAQREARVARMVLRRVCDAIGLLVWHWNEWEGALGDVLGALGKFGDASQDGVEGMPLPALEPAMRLLSALPRMCAFPPEAPTERVSEQRQQRLREFKADGAAALALIAAAIEKALEAAGEEEERGGGGGRGGGGDGGGGGGGGWVVLEGWAGGVAQAALEAAQVWLVVVEVRGEVVVESDVVPGVASVLRGAVECGDGALASAAAAALSGAIGRDPHMRMDGEQPLVQQLWACVVELASWVRPEQSENDIALRSLALVVGMAACKWAHVLVAAIGGDEERIGVAVDWEQFLERFLEALRCGSWQVTWYLAEGVSAIEAEAQQVHVDAREFLFEAADAILPAVRVPEDFDGFSAEGALEFLSSWRVQASTVVQGAMGHEGVWDALMERFVGAAESAIAGWEGGESDGWAETDAALWMVGAGLTSVLPRGAEEQGLRAANGVLEACVLPHLEKLASHPHTCAAVCDVATLAREWVEAAPERGVELLAVALGALEELARLPGGLQAATPSESRVLESATVAVASTLPAFGPEAVSDALATLLPAMDALQSDTKAFARLAPAVARACSRLASPEDAVAALRALCAPSLERLADLASRRVRVLEHAEVVRQAAAVEALTVVVEGVSDDAGRDFVLEEALPTVWAACGALVASELLSEQCSAFLYALLMAHGARFQQNQAMVSEIANEVAERFERSHHTSYVYMGTKLLHVCLPDAEEAADPLRSMTQRLVEQSFELLAGDDVSPFRERPELTRDVFGLLVELLHQAPEFVLEWELLEPACECGAIALQVEHADANAAVFNFFKLLFRTVAPNPRAEGPRPPPEELRRRREDYGEFLASLGPRVVLHTMQGVAGALADSCITHYNGSASTLLLAIRDFDRSFAAEWLHNAFQETLSPDTCDEFHPALVLNETDVERLDRTLFAIRNAEKNQRRGTGWGTH